MNEIEEKWTVILRTNELSSKRTKWVVHDQWTNEMKTSLPLHIPLISPYHFPYYFSISSRVICPNRVSVQGYHVYNSSRSHIFMTISISSHVINPGHFPLQGYIAHTSTRSHIFMLSPFLVTLSAQTVFQFKVIMSIPQHVPISSWYLHF